MIYLIFTESLVKLNLDQLDLYLSGLIFICLIKGILVPYLWSLVKGNLDLYLEALSMAILIFNLGTLSMSTLIFTFGLSKGDLDIHLDVLSCQWQPLSLP